MKIPFQSVQAVNDFPSISTEFASNLHKNYWTQAIPLHPIQSL